jgi:hypothetical protein
MTTSSNSINTDSIETIAGTTTLTIGGGATSVSLKDTITQALTVTGRTTSEIQTNSIGMTYSALAQDTSQRGYQLYLPVVSGTVNSPITSGTIITVTSNNTGPVFMTMALPIGVWSVSYTIRFRPQNTLVTVNTTYIMTTLTLDTPVTYDGVNYFPKYLGLQAVPFPLTAPLDSANRRLSMSGNTIITNNVANTLRLQCQVNGQTVTATDQISPFLGVGGQVFAGNTLFTSFMVATRIA